MNFGGMCGRRSRSQANPAAAGGQFFVPGPKTRLLTMSRPQQVVKPLTTEGPERR